MSWSRQGYENASYCISQTGLQPAMQSPIPLPRVPGSASGVSTHPFSPKRSRSPAVARKTPPARPTSSPITITVPSRASSTWSASLTASTRNRSALPPLSEPGRREDVGVVEDELGIRIRLRLGLRDPLPHRVESLVLDLLPRRVGEPAEPPEVALVAADALVAPVLLDPVEVDVGARVIGGRMRRGAIADRLDERRAAPRPSPLDRLPCRLVHGQDV